MTITFKAKTQDAFVIKILFELLQNNLRTACIELSQEGIKMRMTDYNRHILIDLNLSNENFAIYKCKPEKFYIGVNLSHVHKMLKTIKKKDNITMFIDDEEPTSLCITVEPKENTRVTTSKVKIQFIENIHPELPEGYDKSILVSSSEYQKMIKEMNSIGKTVKIVSKCGYIKFISDEDGIYSKNVTFGESIKDDDEEFMYKNESETFNRIYETDKLTRISKIAGLSNNMQIYTKNDLPLAFRSSVGTLGKISIYVKSNCQIESDENEDSE